MDTPNNRPPYTETAEQQIEVIRRTSDYVKQLTLPNGQVVEDVFSLGEVSELKALQKTLLETNEPGFKTAFGNQAPALILVDVDKRLSQLNSK